MSYVCLIPANSWLNCLTTVLSVIGDDNVDGMRGKSDPVPR